MGTTRNEIIRMAEKHNAPKLISERLNVSPARVYNTLAEERRKGRVIPQFTRGGSACYEPRVCVANWILQAFEEAAQARFMTTRELAADILRAAATEPSLINAILDDGETAS